MSELDQPVGIQVTRREALELCAGLRAYVRSMEQHAEDNTGSHPASDLDRLRLHFGQLIWRLEEAAMSHQQGIEHSDDAVPPEQHVHWP